MKIIKLEGNKQIIRLNCAIKFCSNGLWDDFRYFGNGRFTISNNYNHEDIICEDNISLDIPFKKGASEQTIDYRKRYNNSYFPSKEPLIYDITNEKLKLLLQDIYGIRISSIEIEDEVKFISHKPVRQPKIIKIFSYEERFLITRKVKIKNYESKNSNSK